LTYIVLSDNLKRAWIKVVVSYFNVLKGKSKVLPQRAWTGPRGSR